MAWNVEEFFARRELELVERDWRNGWNAPCNEQPRPAPRTAHAALLVQVSEGPKGPKGPEGV